MKKILYVSIVMMLMSFGAMAKQWGGKGRCKQFPKGSCERVKCRCEKGVRKASKGKPIKHHTNKKGQPTVQKICADAGSVEAGWQAVLAQKKWVAKRCQ